MLNRIGALSIGFSAACLALACGGEDKAPEDPIDEVDPLPTDDPNGCANNPYREDCKEDVEDPPVGAGGTGGTTTVDPPPKSATELAKEVAQNVLKTNCGGCHGTQLTPLTAEAGMNYINDMDLLAKNNKITPLSSEDSFIIRRMRDGTMPPGANRVSDTDIAIVANYIDNEDYWPGVDKKVCNDNAPADFDVLYGDIADDLRKQEDRDQPFIRYVSLRNLTASGVCADTSLDLDRQALTKMLNMLSVDANVYVPEAVDRDQTLFRIDLQEIQWDRAINVNGVDFTDVWEAIVDDNEYAVPFVGDDADDATADSGTAVPVMFLDSMLNSATIGNLYYSIINVDVNQSLDVFVSDVLEINVQENLDNEDLVRAGTTQSDISRQDRLVEGHEINARQGVYYQSFDFEDDQNESIFQDPFGFNEGGREAIFTLPNGMLAYLIADANGNLVEDSDILLDSTQGNFRAVTSVSCSNCHVSGFIPVVDEVREQVEANAILLIQDGTLNQDQLEQLSAVYLTPDKFKQKIESDSTLYLNALRSAALPVSGVEPVSRSFNRFDKDMPIEVAAGDLGVTKAQLLDTLNLLDPALNVLERRTIDRDDFTALYVNSLCILGQANQNQPDAAACAAAEAALDN